MKKTNSKKSGSAATTTSTATREKSKIKNKKEKKTPNKSSVTSQTKKIKTPKKSQVTSQDKLEAIKKKLIKKQKSESSKKSSAANEEESNIRSTTWTFLVYEDSAPKNWREILKNLHVPFVVSPRHDKDIDDNGNKKKPHYHVIIRYRSKKSFSKVKEEVCDQVGGPRPQNVIDFAMMVRYLIHLDDPEKYQYNADEVEVYGNIDVKQYLYTKKQYQFEILKEILDFCERYNVTEYSTIANYAKDEYPRWFPYVTKVFRATIDSYVRSQRYASEHGE